MLILTRRRGESIVIQWSAELAPSLPKGSDGAGPAANPRSLQIEVTLLQVQGDQVRLGITAPKDVTIHRKELLEQIRAENIAAAAAQPEQVSQISEAPASDSAEAEPDGNRDG